MTAPDEVLEFWFGEIAEDGSVAKEVAQRWWKKDPQFDSEVESRFGAAISAAEAGKLDEWLESPRSALAFVILCDQFTRNTRRGRPETYAADPKALAATRRAIELGHDEKLHTVERHFLYMPLMHSEELADQNESIERLDHLVTVAEPGALGAAKKAAEAAREHQVIVKRFGRFPHRNDLLGRESSEEEREFLTQPGSSF